jgi:hypothetical protein
VESSFDIGKPAFRRRTGYLHLLVYFAGGHAAHSNHVLGADGIPDKIEAHKGIEMARRHGMISTGFFAFRMMR